MKKKIVFIISLITLLCITSFGGTYFYKNLKNIRDEQSVSINTSSTFTNAIASDVYSIAANFIDEDQYVSTFYKACSYNEQEYTEAVAKDNFINFMEDIITNIEYEPNLYYVATSGDKTSSNVDSKELIASIEDKNWESKYQWYMILTFDKDGKMSSKCSEGYLDNNWFDEATLECYNSGYTAVDGDFYFEFKNPKNLTITMAVPKTLEANGEIYLSTGEKDHMLCYASIGLLGIASIIICIFMIFYPIASVKEIEPYKSLSKIKFGLLMCIEAFVLLGLGSLSWVLFYEDLVGDFQMFLTNIKLPIYLVWVSQSLVWMAFLFVVSDVMFEFKFIFHTGFKKFINEYTILGWIVKSIKAFAHLDFNTPVNKLSIKVTIINLIAMLVIWIASICVDSFIFGIVCTVIYAIVIFIVVKEQFAKTKNDYDAVYNYASEISNGNFDEAVMSDVGIYNDLESTLGHVRDGFEKAVQEETKSQNMKNELVSNVSHDLKTPLTNIITYVDLLSNEDLSEDQKKYVDVLNRNSMRLKKLIEDLFEVSKVNSGDVKLTSVEMDLIALIKQVQFDFEDNFNKKGITVRFNSSLENAMVKLDSEKTVRIFENLFVNIEKHAMDNTRVFIDVEQVENNVQVIFKNISKEEIKFNDEEITERFVQGDASRTNGGSGLGLAIVKSFTEIQNGTFHVESEADLFKAVLTFPLLNK